MQTIAGQWARLVEISPFINGAPEEVRIFFKHFFYSGAAATLGLHAELAHAQSDDEARAMVNVWLTELEQFSAQKTLKQWSLDMTSEPGKGTPI